MPKAKIDDGQALAGKTIAVVSPNRYWNKRTSWGKRLQKLLMEAGAEDIRNIYIKVPHPENDNQFPPELPSAFDIKSCHDGSETMMAIGCLPQMVIIDLSGFEKKEADSLRKQVMAMVKSTYMDGIHIVLHDPLCPRAMKKKLCDAEVKVLEPLEVAGDARLLEALGRRIRGQTFGGMAMD